MDITALILELIQVREVFGDLPVTVDDKPVTLVIVENTAVGRVVKIEPGLKLTFRHPLDIMAP